MSKHKIKIVYEKGLVVKSIHNSKDSLKKVISFLFYLKLIFQKFVFKLFAFMLFGT